MNGFQSSSYGPGSVRLSSVGVTCGWGAQYPRAGCLCGLWRSGCSGRTVEGCWGARCPASPLALPCTCSNLPPGFLLGADPGLPYICFTGNRVRAPGVQPGHCSPMKAPAACPAQPSPGPGWARCPAPSSRSSPGTRVPGPRGGGAVGTPSPTSVFTVRDAEAQAGQCRVHSHTAGRWQLRGLSSGHPCPACSPLLHMHGLPRHCACGPSKPPQQRHGQWV